MLDISGLFENKAVENGSNADLQRSHGENYLSQMRRRYFKNEIDGILASEDKVDKLKAFAFEQNEPDSFLPTEAMTLLSLMRQSSMFPEMTELYEKSSHPDLKKSPIVREIMIAAYNKSGNTEEAIRISKRLVGEGNGNADILAGLGSSYNKKYLAAKKLSESYSEGNSPSEEAIEAYKKHFPKDASLKHYEDNAEKALDLSLKYYEQGFQSSYSYYPGINTAYRYLDKGNVEEAKNFAELTYLACTRDGGNEDKNDFWMNATMIEAGCIANAPYEKMDRWFKRIEDNKTPYWQIDTTLGSMKNGMARMKELGQDTTTFEKVVNRMESYLEGHTKDEVLFQDTNRAKEDSSLSAVDTFYREKTHSFRGSASEFTGAEIKTGNMYFGGGLKDVGIARSDFEEIGKVLNLPVEQINGTEQPTGSKESLLDIDNPMKVIKEFDKIIRRAFRTEEQDLEHITSAGHKRFDETTEAFNEFSAVNGERELNTRTSLAASFALGLGDCRHHNETKQIMFDEWQRIKMNKLLEKSYDSLQAKDNKAYKENVKKLKELQSYELRIFDTQIYAPIKVEGLYKPVVKDGMPVAEESGKLNKVEEHTMCFMFKTDPNSTDRRVEKISFADSFYQKEYSFGEGDANLDGITFDKNGNIFMSGKTIEALDENGNKKDVAVTLTPAGYAKKDRTSEREVLDEIGKAVISGLPAQSKVDLVTELTNPEQHKETLKRLEAIRKWFVLNKLREEKQKQGNNTEAVETNTPVTNKKDNTLDIIKKKKDLTK